MFLKLAYLPSKPRKYLFRISGFSDLANFWFGFSVFALKNCGFSVLVFYAVCRFSPINLVLDFRFLSTMIFLSNAVTVFLVSPRKLQLAVALKL